VDSQTRHALKQDKFVRATQQSASWVGDHRSTVIRWSIAVVVVLALVVAGIVYYMQRSDGCGDGFGLGFRRLLVAAGSAGSPGGKGHLCDGADRSKAANQQFVQVASQYGWLPEGAKAHYFAGLTYQELGQTASAETELKAAAGSWDGNLVQPGEICAGGVLSPDRARRTGH
jgi:hypothetical protein